MPRPQIIFLDFDGVIMDSMDLKLDSYCYAFEGYGFSREAIHNMQLASAGLSRSKTIPLIYLALSGKPMTDLQIQEALARFTVHDEASRGAMVLKEGALEFLETMRARRIHMAIITGTPKEVIDKTVEHFKLGVYFLQVCGAPSSKPEHMERMIQEYRLEAEKCLFVGDAIMDQEAAITAKVPFIGLNNGDDPFRPGGLYKEVRALSEIIPLVLN